MLRFKDIKEGVEIDSIKKYYDEGKLQKLFLLLGWTSDNLIFNNNIKVSVGNVGIKSYFIGKGLRLFRIVNTDFDVLPTLKDREIIMRNLNNQFIFCIGLFSNQSEIYYSIYSNGKYLEFTKDKIYEFLQQLDLKEIDAINCIKKLVEYYKI